ncbi:hypothetical protein [Fibrobacter sp. UWH9]|uniref:hypothetical protein n=1 Tax=Fibrobacter sp. UWH9 TaxID=1896213 RepID=UPI00111473D6|nr:hypothetical protein [Fibrobacter sp. UWH9]
MNEKQQLRKRDFDHLADFGIAMRGFRRSSSGFQQRMCGFRYQKCGFRGLICGFRKNLADSAIWARRFYHAA